MLENLILLSDIPTRYIFEFIARRRKAIYKEIRYAVEEEMNYRPPQTSEVDRSLQELKNAGFIEEKASPIKDFKLYYVTAEGLSVERKLRQRAAAA